MAKRNQILRVPQKKYTEATLEDFSTINLPHEQLIPAQNSGNTASRTSIANPSFVTSTGNSGVTSITSTGSKNSKTAETQTRDKPAKNGKANSRRVSSQTAQTITGSGSHTGITSTFEKNNSDNETGFELKGRARDVWKYFCQVINQQEPHNNRVRASRRQIQKESGIGSLNTIDAAIAMLQGRGWLRVHPLPGSNEGYEYEVLQEQSRNERSQTPKTVAELLRQTALILEEKSDSLSPEQVNKWSKIAFQAMRLTEDIK